MLSKKHYEAIANIIKKCSTCNATQTLWQDNASYNIAENIANYFAQDNPRFNRQMFLDACKGD